MKRPLVTVLFTALLAAPAARADDAAVRRVLQEEIAGAMKTLAGKGGPAPHHIAVQLYDVERAVAETQQGTVASALVRRYRALRVVVRVGDRSFDDGNFSFGFIGNVAVAREAPLDDLVPALRATISAKIRAAYETGVRALAAKRKAVAAQPDRPGDASFAFAEAPAANIVAAGPGTRAPVDAAALARLTAALSGAAHEIAAVSRSRGYGRQTLVRRRLLTSEGQWVDERRSFVQLRIAAEAHTTDGSPVGSQVLFNALELARLPPLPVMQKAARAMAGEVVALLDAPAVEAGKAVVLFEGQAAGVLVRHLLDRAASGTPQPRLEAGRKPWGAPPFLPPLLGRPVAPAFLEMFDDPRVELGPGQVPLFGHYAADEEGVAPTRVSILERGRLVALPMSRTPRAGITRSNGHARGAPMAGAFEGRLGALFVSAGAAGLSDAALRERALAEARAAGPGTTVYVVRRVDTDAIDDEENGPLHFVAGQGWGGSYAVGGGLWEGPLRPLVAFRLRDGKEELVRGMAFPRPFEAARLADIIAAGKEPQVLNYFAQPAVRGAGELMLPTSAVTPSLVLAKVEVTRAGTRTPRPLYPPPALAPSASVCHDLPLTGRSVRERLIAKVVPEARGGQLRDGVYDGIGDDYYVGPGRKEDVTSNVRRRTVRIKGNQIDFVVHQEAPEGVVLRSRGTVTVEGTTLRIATVCPQMTTDRISFTAAGDSLLLYNGVGGRNVDVYTRRP